MARASVTSRIRCCVSRRGFRSRVPPAGSARNPRAVVPTSCKAGDRRRVRVRVRHASSSSKIAREDLICVVARRHDDCARADAGQGLHVCVRGSWLVQELAWVPDASADRRCGRGGRAREQRPAYANTRHGDTERDPTAPVEPRRDDLGIRNRGMPAQIRQRPHRAQQISLEHSG